MNVSERTLQRYLKRENIQSRQVLEEVRIDWNNLNQIPNAEGARRAAFNMQPYFLQDEIGKRYPPKPAIARKLLNQGHGAWLMKRSVNLYWYGSEPLPDGADEWLVQKVYLATGNLQEVEARQLVDKYGRKAVGQALGRMEYMREKDDLKNPAGFMKVVSRVCWLAINGFDKPRPEYQAPKKRKPRQVPYNSEKDPIWQSESYRNWRLAFKEAPIDIWEIPCLDNEIEF